MQHAADITFGKASEALFLHINNYLLRHVCFVLRKNKQPFNICKIPALFISLSRL